MNRLSRKPDQFLVVRRNQQGVVQQKTPIAAVARRFQVRQVTMNAKVDLRRVADHQVPSRGAGFGQLPVRPGNGLERHIVGIELVVRRLQIAPGLIWSGKLPEGLLATSAATWISRRVRRLSPS